MEQKGRSWVQASLFLCFLTSDAMWPPASSHHAFPTWWTASWTLKAWATASPSFFPYVVFAGYFIIATGMVTILFKSVSTQKTMFLCSPTQSFTYIVWVATLVSLSCNVDLPLRPSGWRYTKQLFVLNHHLLHVLLYLHKHADSSLVLCVMPKGWHWQSLTDSQNKF